MLCIRGFAAKGPGPPAAAQREAFRPAFTLLELLIVLSIIASMMAIAWPRMRGMSDQAALREASLGIKRVLAEARDRAVNEGTEIRFVFYLDSARYKIEPDSTYVPPVATSVSNDAASATAALTEMSTDFETSRANSVGPTDDASAAVYIDPDLEGVSTGSLIVDPSIRSLPDSITFVEKAKLTQNALVPLTPATGIDGLGIDELDADDLVSIGTSDVTPTDTGETITFYSDGRSSNEQIHLFSSELNKVITLNLRGLTGSVTLGPTETLTEPGSTRVSDSLDATESGDGFGLEGTPPASGDESSGFAF